MFASDRAFKDRRLPRLLDGPSAAKLMTAARALPDRFDRPAVELLARAGMRKDELLGLTVDAVVQIGSAYWLRTPVGKMRTAPSPRPPQTRNNISIRPAPGNFVIADGGN